jgi:Rad52/22 family double-strand break repair protein
MSTYSHGMAGYLSDEQLAALLGPIKPHRVSKDGKGFSHVEAYEIRSHLSRIFGLARWDEEVISQDLVFESASSGEKPKWTVCYRSLVRLTVRAADGTHLATYTEGATGDATNMPSRADAHDMALKTSQSQALKRCAVNLGDQFGLSLYNKGSYSPLVRLSLVGMPVAADAEVDAHITGPLAPENGEPETPQREVSSPPSQPVASAVPVAVEPARVDPPAADPPYYASMSEALTHAEYPMDAQDSRELVAAENAMAELDPLSEAVAAAEAAFPGAVVEPDPFEWCLNEIKAARAMPPADAIAKLTGIMEVAVRHQLRARRMPGDGNETLGAALTRLTGMAANAAKRAANAS